MILQITPKAPKKLWKLFEYKDRAEFIGTLSLLCSSLELEAEIKVIIFPDCDQVLRDNLDHAELYKSFPPIIAVYTSAKSAHECLADYSIIFTHIKEYGLENMLDIFMVAYDEEEKENTLCPFVAYFLSFTAPADCNEYERQKFMRDMTEIAFGDSEDFHTGVLFVFFGLGTIVCKDPFVNVTNYYNIPFCQN